MLTRVLIDPLTGRRARRSSSAAIVRRRPNLPEGACPFCVGGLEAPSRTTCGAFVNRFPSMPDDRCEVVLYTPQHDAHASRRSASTARAASSTCGPSARAALGARDDVAYVLVFENRGAEVGATIAHPHGQIYAFDDVPPAPATEGDLLADRADRRRRPPSSRSSEGWQRVGAACVGLADRPAPRAATSRAPDLPSLDPHARDGPRRAPRRRRSAGSTASTTRRSPTCSGSTNDRSTGASWHGAAAARRTSCRRGATPASLGSSPPASSAPASSSTRCARSDRGRGVASRDPA